MKPEDYELARELFHSLADLPRDQRKDFLLKKNVSSDVISYVEALLEHDEEMESGSEDTHRAPIDASPIPDSDRVEKLAGLFKEAIGGDEEQQRDFMDTLAREASEESTRIGSMRSGTFFGKLKQIYGEEANPENSLIADPEEHPEYIPSHDKLHDRYELRGQVAEGGMGKILRVWDKPLRRNIAMKVIAGASSSGMGRSPSPSASFVRRFVEEAQITGQLDHPGVVPVHELALNENGEVFFTMRLIRGITFKEAIKKVKAGEDGWTLTRALNRLLRVCETMAFAHKREVVHRDLKPANIMLGEYGETYVMDWGLAKILGHPEEGNPETGKEKSTAPSPIETDRSSEDADSTEGRIYTLDGEVIGTPAYMPPEQAGGDRTAVGLQADVYAMGAVLYHLLAGHPPFAPPDSRVTAREILDRVRKGPPENLSTTVRGVPEELIAICNKAMAREVKDRYPDMGVMAEDVRAYLEGRVVKAYRTGALVELNKWIKRNKKLAASVAITIVVALSFLSGMLYLEAQHRIEVEKEAKTSARVVEFLTGMFEEEEPDRALGQHVTVKEVLDREVPRMAQELESEPEVRARILETMGAVYLSLGLYPEAEPLFRTCLELTRKTHGNSDVNTLMSMGNLANLLRNMGQYPESEQLYLTALTEGEKVLGSDHPKILDYISDMGFLYFKMGRIDEAERYLREAIERRQRILGSEDLETLRTLNNLGVLLRLAGRLDEAEATLSEVLQARQEQTDEDNTEIFTIKGNLAQTYQALGRIEDAEKLWRETLAGRRRVLGEDHPQTIKNLHNLSILLLIQGRMDEGIKGLRESLELSRSILGEDHPTIFATIVVLAKALKQTGQYHESERLYLEAIPNVRKLENTQPLQITLSGLAHLYVLQSRYAEATPLIIETTEIIRETGRAHPDVIPEQEDCLRRFEMYLRHLSDQKAFDPETLECQMDLAEIYFTSGRHQEALHLAEEVLDKTDKDDPEYKERTAFCATVRSELESNQD